MYYKILDFSFGHHWKSWNFAEILNLALEKINVELGKLRFVAPLPLVTKPSLIFISSITCHSHLSWYITPWAWSVRLLAALPPPTTRTIIALSIGVVFSLSWQNKRRAWRSHDLLELDQTGLLSVPSVRSSHPHTSLVPWLNRHRFVVVWSCKNLCWCRTTFVTWVLELEPMHVTHVSLFTFLKLTTSAHNSHLFKLSQSLIIFPLYEINPLSHLEFIVGLGIYLI